MKKILLATTLVCAFAAPALADEMTVGNNYASLSGGVIMPEDIESSGVTLSFKTGYTVSGAIGTWINDSLTIGGEVTYLSADFDDAELFGISVPVEGDFSSTLVLADAAFHLNGKAATFDPYVGAGLGVAFSHLKVDSIGGTPVNFSDSATDAAGQLSAGLNFTVSPGLSVGAAYRYLYIDSGNDNTDSFGGHSVSANVTFAF